MESRRDSLKIIGAIGTTCAFPFSADELYGQHQHAAAMAQQTATPKTPVFFTPAEFATLSLVTELIVPATDTPGAIAAGVPLYIDQVVNLNPEHKRRFRAGLAWLDAEAGRRFGKPFGKITGPQQIALLTPLCDAVDADRVNSVGEKFFRLVKSMTADGYYTSQIGLVKELGYSGNTALEKFPECHEH